MVGVALYRLQLALAESPSGWWHSHGGQARTWLALAEFLRGSGIIMGIMVGIACGAPLSGGVVVVTSWSHATRSL